MKTAPLGIQEKERIASLLRYDILDSAYEVAYDELTALAAFICQTPIALISLVDTQRQWFKAKVGLDARETPRDIAFCAHAILGKEVFVVKDTLKDERFFDNPLVTSAPHIRSYAGAPLVTPDGLALGTLCAIDRIPRELSAPQLQALHTLANQVIKLLELRHSFHRLQTYAAQLQQANDSKDLLFSVIAHDLRSPFTALLGLAEVLASEAGSLPAREVQDLSSELLTASRQAFTLVENLLEWAQMESGLMSPRRTLLAVDGLASGVIDVLAKAAEKKKITLALRPNTAAVLYADQHMMYSVLQNLLTNALKFTPAGGCVTVSSQVAADVVSVTVADTGVGLSPTQLENLWRMNKAATTQGTSGEKGTGLGLLLCKKFVEMNDGKLTVISHPGQGTTFTFTLPGGQSREKQSVAG